MVILCYKFLDQSNQSSRDVDGKCTKDICYDIPFITSYVIQTRVYCSLEFVFSNNLCSQNLAKDPSLIVNGPKCRKYYFPFMRLAIKWESLVFQYARHKILNPRYLLWIMCFKVPSYVSNLKTIC